VRVAAKHSRAERDSSSARLQANAAGAPEIAERRDEATTLTVAVLPTQLRFPITRIVVPRGRARGDPDRGEAVARFVAGA